MQHSWFIGRTSVLWEQLQKDSSRRQPTPQFSMKSESESILQSKLKLPEDKLEQHRVADLSLSADEAVAAGLATSIGDFMPPKGQRMFYIGAP